MLDIYGRIMEGQLYLGWTYSENLHRRYTIEWLAHGYLEALRSLIAIANHPRLAATLLPISLKRNSVRLRWTPSLQSSLR